MRHVTRESVLALFEKHRASPGSSYDEHHFLDFLLLEPKGKGAVRNSFRGLRRFNRFIDEVQCEYGVCFSLKDCETQFSVDAFVRRTGELQRAPAGSLRSLSNQQRAGAGWQVPIVAGLILAALAYALRGLPLVSGCLVLGIVVVVAKFAQFDVKSRAYRHRLRAGINELQRKVPSNESPERTRER